MNVTLAYHNPHCCVVTVVFLCVLLVVCNPPLTLWWASAWWRRLLSTWPMFWRTAETKCRRISWPTEVINLKLSPWCPNTALARSSGQSYGFGVPKEVMGGQNQSKSKPEVLHYCVLGWRIFHLTKGSAYLSGFHSSQLTWSPISPDSSGIWPSIQSNSPWKTSLRSSPRYVRKHWLADAVLNPSSCFYQAKKVQIVILTYLNVRSFSQNQKTSSPIGFVLIRVD